MSMWFEGANFLSIIINYITIKLLWKESYDLTQFAIDLKVIRCPQEFESVFVTNYN